MTRLPSRLRKRSTGGRSEEAGARQIVGSPNLGNVADRAPQSIFHFVQGRILDVQKQIAAGAAELDRAAVRRIAAEILLDVRQRGQPIEIDRSLRLDADLSVVGRHQDGGVADLPRCLLIEQPLQQGEDGIDFGGELVRVGTVFVSQMVDAVGVEEEVTLGGIRRARS